MTLVGIERLDDGPEWERITSGAFSGLYNDGPGNRDTRYTVVITITETSENRVSSSSSRRNLRGGGGGGGEGRALQSSSPEGQSLNVTYAQDLFYSGIDPSGYDSYDILALYPLSTYANRDAYVGELKSLGGGYEDLTDVSEITFSSGGGGIPAPSPVIDPESEGNNAGAIVGGVVGGLLALAGLFVYARYRKTKNDEDAVDDADAIVARKDEEVSAMSADELAADDAGAAPPPHDGDYGVVGGEGLSSSQAPDEQSVVTFDYNYTSTIGAVAGGDGNSPSSAREGSESTLTIDLDQAYDDDDDDVVGGIGADEEMSSSSGAGDGSLSSSERRLLYEDLDEEFLNVLNAPAPTRVSSSDDSDEERAPSPSEDDDATEDIGDVLCPPDPPGPDPPAADDWDPSAGGPSDPPIVNSDEGIEVPYVDGDGVSASSSIEGDRGVSSVDDDQLYEENEEHDSAGVPDEAIEVPCDEAGARSDGSNTLSTEGGRSAALVDDDRECENDENDGAAVGSDDESTSSSEFDRNQDQALSEGDRSVSSIDDDQENKDLSAEFDHLLDEAIETTYDGAAVGVDEESTSAAGVDRSVDDQEYEDNLHDVSYAPAGRLEGIIETPDDRASTPAAGEGDRSVSSVDYDDQDCEHDEGKFPDVLYSPAGMPLDTVIETQCDSSERSSVDHEQEYFIGEEQMPNYGAIDMTDELQIAGNAREEREEGRSSPTPSNSMSSSSSPDARSSSTTEERAEGRSSPTPSKTRSISSRSTVSSKSTSIKRKERKSDSIFDSAQKAILQAQEILQTLSLESSSSSSCAPDQASADSSSRGR